MAKEYEDVKTTNGEMTYDTGMRRERNTGRGNPSLISPYMLERLSKHMENGAKKYSEDNWSKGAPFRRFTESIGRHWIAWSMNKDDEDHLSAIIFNAMCIMHFQETGRELELNNMPDWKGGYLNEKYKKD